MVPLVVLVGWLTQPALDRLSARSLSEGFLKQSVLIETIGAIETVKASGAGPLLSGRWSQAIEQHSDSSLRQRLVRGDRHQYRRRGGHDLLRWAWWSSAPGMIAENELTMGALIACSILAGGRWRRWRRSRSCFRASAPPRPPIASSARSWRCRSKGHRERRSSRLRSPAKSSSGTPASATRAQAEKTLNEISFTINPGEHVAAARPGRFGQVDDRAPDSRPLSRR
jgi:ATP-binding cassette subfamily C protein LapB